MLRKLGLGAALTALTCAVHAQDAKPLTYSSTVTPPAGLELVVNGGFEADRIAAGTWTTSNALTGWSGGSAGIELRNNVAGSAQEGLQYVELDTSKNSVMYQDLLGSSKLVSGPVQLSFWYSARPGTTADTNGLKVGFGTDLRTVMVPGNSSSANVWQQWQGTFNLTNSDVLMFLARGTSDSYGTSIDRVSVTPVPEVATSAQVALGLGAVAAWALRRARKATSR